LNIAREMIKLLNKKKKKKRSETFQLATKKTNIDVNEVYEPKCNNENRSLRPICPIVCLGQEEKPENNFA
jgi:hypothetical protein